MTTFATSQPDTLPKPRARNWCIYLLAAINLLLLLARVTISLIRQSRLTHESGVWTTLAMDFARGTLYRPLIGPDGYGGTRYFPLQIILQGTLIRIGLSPIHAGFLILLASLITLIASFYLLLRRLTIPRDLAAPATIMVLGTAAAEMAITMIRGDLLPASLNIAALAILAPFIPQLDTELTNETQKNSTAKSWLLATIAAVLFSLAFLAKATTIFGAAAAVLALWFSRRKLLSLWIFLISAGLALASLYLVQSLSHGTFLDNLKNCAGGGEMSWAIRHLPLRLATVVVHNDPIGLLILMAGSTAWFIAPRSIKQTLPGQLILTTTIVTFLIFLTPGIDKNHLLDLQIASALLLAFLGTTSITAHRLARAAIAFILVFEITTAIEGVLGDNVPRRAMYQQVIQDARANQPGPILTDFALLPILENQRPYLLDDFMLPVIATHRPEIRRDLYEKLDKGFFAAVILKADPAAEGRERVWGPTFTTHLKNRYQLANSDHGFLTFRRQTIPTSTTQPQ